MTGQRRSACTPAPRPHRCTLAGSATTPALLEGDHVQFAEDSTWWTVRAIAPSGEHIVLTPSAGPAAGYTVIAVRDRRRGPHSSAGPWPTETPEHCRAIAIALDFGAATGHRSGLALDQQRALPLVIDDVRRTHPR